MPVLTRVFSAKKVRRVFFALAALVFLTAMAGVSVSACNKSEPIVFGPTDGDARLDGDDVSDGDFQPDGDAPLDGDFQPDGDGIADGDRSDGDYDTYDPGVHIILTNTGDLPGYVEGNGYPQEVNGVALLSGASGGDPLWLTMGCTIDCSDECVPVACEPPEPSVLQVLPGETIEYHWNGEVFDPASCASDEFGQVACVNRRRLDNGSYAARFCYSPQMTRSDAAWDTAGRRQEDRIYGYTLAERQCVQFEITLTNGLTESRENFAPSLGEQKKTFGACGRAWTFTPFPHIAPLVAPETGYSYTDAQHPLIAVGLEPDSFAGQCYRFGDMRARVLEDERRIVLSHGLYYSQAGCEMNEVDTSFGHLLPLLEAGAWTIEVESYTDFAYPSWPLDIAIHRAHECTRNRALGEDCLSGCVCQNESHVCTGQCESPCLSHLDCVGGYACRELVGFSPPRRHCTLIDGPDCYYDGQCEDGTVCQAADGRREHRLCVPDLDTRALDPENGMGVHCGCDLECPGAQSCVRMQMNFSDGFCALTCRDTRDCPADWSCLGMTQSGLQAICVPNNAS